MACVKTKFRVPSSDKIHNLAGVIYLPECEPVGFFHIVHGMTDHIARYDRIMRDLSDLGYICFGYDNLGHGHTVNDKSELGFIAEKNGHDFLARDVKIFSDAVKAEYGDSLPYYLMGHSMGSFITRYAVSKYVNPDKYIIMGTAGKNPLAYAGLTMATIIKTFRGGRYISPMLDDMAFKSYNDRFEHCENDPSPWLSTDDEQRAKYYSDEFCTFKFTVSAMSDLVRLNKLISRDECFENTPDNLPILLLSGENDPVGNYGEGVREVHANFIKHQKNAKCILYPKARHEILNDFCYDQVKDDIVEFLK